MDQKERFNPNLRFQLRNGYNDIQIFIKNHDQKNFEPYREVDISTIVDDTVPEYKSKEKYPGNEDEDTNNPDEEGFVVPRKRRKSGSPEANTKKKRVMSPIKLYNYLAGFLTGTTTTPHQSLFHEEEEELNTQDILSVEDEVLQLAAMQ